MRARTAPPPKARLRCSPRQSNRTCGSWLESPRVPVALTMPIADPEHQQPHGERHAAEIDPGAHICFIAAVARNERLVQCRQAVHFGKMFDRLIDRAQGLLLAAVVVAQDV